MGELRAGGIAMVLHSSDPHVMIHNSWVGCSVRLIRFIPRLTLITDCLDMNDGKPFMHKQDVWLITDGENSGTTPPKYLMPIDGEDFSCDFQAKKEPGVS
ncbi:hypothetical protein [Clostridium perfringens]|uniref:hypothetical protein n=1 Tax=Clostridium perfringens TaxID=1502 RepID=UPI0032216143